MVSIASPPPGSGRSRPRRPGSPHPEPQRAPLAVSGDVRRPRRVRRSSRGPVSSHPLPAATGDWWRSSWARCTIRSRTRRVARVRVRWVHEADPSLGRGPMSGTLAIREERCRSLREPSCPRSSRQRRSITSVSRSAPTHMRLSRRPRALAWERSSSSIPGHTIGSVPLDRQHGAPAACVVGSVVGARRASPRTIDRRRGPRALRLTRRAPPASTGALVACSAT